MKKAVETSYPYFLFGHLERCPELLHFVSSGEEKEAGNLSLTVESGRENRLRLAEAVGFRPEQLTVGEQVHSACVTVVSEEDRGKGSMDHFSRLPATDALVTNIPGICLMVLTADCVPVLLYDFKRRVIAAVHAGWRGTAGGIVKATVERMQAVYGCRPSRLLAGIGPSIGPCCFEVGEEVARVFIAQDREEAVERVGEKYHVDLGAINKEQLREAGVLESHIENAGVCTRCSRPAFFSYRGGDAVFRFGSGIMLKER